MELSEEFKNGLLEKIKVDMEEADNYYETVIKPSVEDRYNLYHADADYYEAKFPRLSKQSTLVSTDVADTIEWALPSLQRLFFANQDIVTIEGVGGEDERKAKVMEKLLSFQLQRKNNFFLVAYSWFKDAMITGLGIVKCYWERETQMVPHTETVNYAMLVEMKRRGMQIVAVEPLDAMNFKVTYVEEIYTKNQPKIENILASEFRFLPGYKSLDECPFIAHKTTTTMGYLRKREREGIFANVELVKPSGGYSVNTDTLEQKMNSNYQPTPNRLEEPRTPVDLWECYAEIDVNEDGIGEQIIVHIAEDVILRIEENYMGRHPFFGISPVKDPHRIWPFKSMAEMIGQLQDLKTALQRQLLINISLSNDPKMILSEEAINIDDYIKGRAVIRKKPGFAIADVAQPLPVTPLHPWTFNFLEYIEGQKEARSGITRYNQGLDASSLNKTATGISQIMGASNQRLELIARIFLETGFAPLLRFLVSLNQRFIDQPLVIRLANEPMQINPEDMNGELDLIVNAGVGITSKESTILNLQTMLTAIMQVMGTGIPVATPTNIYNLLFRWAQEIGFKNPNDFVTDPVITQQRMMVQQGMLMAVINGLPPEIQQQYFATGTLPPEIMIKLPPPAQQALMGGMYGGATTGVGAGVPQGQPSNPNAGVSTGVAGEQKRGDNRKPQNMPRRSTSEMAKPPREPGIASFSNGG